jgi:GTP-binding protein Era
VNDPTPDGHRSGYVALAGKPNVGKSTLLNSLLKQGLMAVSPKPQTTRRRQVGILTLERAQLVFLDTPGIHAPRHKLGRLMLEEAVTALGEADLALAVFDLHVVPDEADALVAEQVIARSGSRPMLAALNKADLVRPESLQQQWEAYQALLPGVDLLLTSALRGDNLTELVERIVDRLPLGPRFYPEGEITDAFERDIAADMIRAAGMQLLRQEVPHALAVQVDEYQERGETGAFIGATVYVERESQKGIVIGKGGHMLRDIGKLARQQIEAMSGRKVFLQLKVKVLPGWRDDERALQRLGYKSGR